jgi:chromosome segregation ATPase
VIDQTLIENVLATAGPSRRDRVFAVAELIHRHQGTLPSIQETRGYVGRGSYGDISRDLKDFAAIISAKVTQAATIPGMPRDLELKMNEVMAGLWQTIYEKAESEFVADRTAHEIELSALTDKLTVSENERLQVVEDRTTALHRLADLERQLSAANHSVEAEQRKVSERDSTISQLQARIGEMETEKIRLQAEHDHDLASLKATVLEKDNRILDLQNASATIKAGYENQLSAARQLESEHRMRADKADAGRQKLQEQQESTGQELARLKGQIEAMTSRNQEMEEKFTKNITLFTISESKLSRTKEALHEAITENGLLSTQCASLTAIVEQKTAELAAARAEIARKREQSDASS